MPRTNDAPTTRIHIHLFQEDVDFIRMVYGGNGNIGQSEAIRAIVHKYVKALKAKVAEKAQSLDGLNVEEIASMRTGT